MSAPKRTKTESKAVERGGGVAALHPELADRLAGYRKERAFDPAAWVKDKVAKYNGYMSKHGLTAAVVSVSGGVDSAVTLALMMAAKKAEGSGLKRVMGVNQPIKSSGWALARAKECTEALGAEFAVVDQSDIHTALSKAVSSAVGIEGGSFADGQLRSYMRTPVGYYVAQLLSQAGTPCVVMGTGNMDEDGYLAYFCKAGDGVVDIQLIADLHKSEVFAVGRYLGVPDSILDAPPSADLWDGQTDEEELGFTYDFVELLTGHYLKLDDAGQAAFKASLAADALEEFNRCEAAAAAVHRRNAHKLAGVVNL